MFKIFKTILQWFRPEQSRFQRGFNYAIEQMSNGKSEENLLAEVSKTGQYNNFDEGIAVAIELNCTGQSAPNLPPNI